MKNSIFREMREQSRPDKAVTDSLKKRLAEEEGKSRFRWIYAVSAAACIALIAGISASMFAAYGNDNITPATDVYMSEWEPIDSSAYIGSENAAQNEYDVPLSATVEGMVYDYLSKYSAEADTLTYKIGNGTVDISIYDFLPMLKDHLSVECSDEEFDVSENSVTLQWKYPDRDSVMYFIIDEHNGMIRYSDEWEDSRNYFHFDSSELYSNVYAEIKRILIEEERRKQMEAENSRQQAEEEEQLRKQAEEEELRKRHEEESIAEVGSISLTRPVPEIPEITTPYGYGQDQTEWHKGVDFSAPDCEGMDIVAAADGKVISARDTGNGYGICIIIDNGNWEHGKYSTLYAHCSEALVSEGDEVRAGDVIGKIGSTGYAYGAHLHFEVILLGELAGGEHVDPEPYFDELPDGHRVDPEPYFN